MLAHRTPIRLVTPATLAGLLALPLAALIAARTEPAPAAPLALAAAEPQVEWPDAPGGQLVFFAVLEGLYLDGVQPEVVRAVLTGPPGGEPPDAPQAPDVARRRMLETTLFVPGCPVCTPVLVAFETYAARGSLHLKSARDTLGPGLPDDDVARLQSPCRTERLAALEGLVTTWIARRLDLGRATASEREQFRIWMEEGRKLGLSQLTSLRKDLDAAAAASWPRCASCDGSVQGCLR